MQAGISVDQAIDPHEDSGTSCTIAQPFDPASVLVGLLNAPAASVACGLRIRIRKRVNRAAQALRLAAAALIRTLSVKINRNGEAAQRILQLEHLPLGWLHRGQREAQLLLAEGV